MIDDDKYNIKSLNSFPYSNSKSFRRIDFS